MKRRVFAGKPQDYLLTEVYEKIIHNVSGSRRVEIDLGLVKDWMFSLDGVIVIYVINGVTIQISRFDLHHKILIFLVYCHLYTYTVPGTAITITPGQNPDGSATQLFGTGTFNGVNQFEILQTLVF